MPADKQNGSGRCHLKICNALVIDGSDTPGYLADVAVESDRIAAIGNLSEKD